jgi:hypothetical protein
MGDYVPDTDTTTYLRVQKTGTNYTGWWSSDGVNWTPGATGVLTPRPFIGIDVTLYPWDGAQVDSSANFYYFHALPNPPILSIETEPGNQVALYWPAAAYGFVLQSAANLQSPTTWNFVTNTPSTNGSWIYVTNATGQSSQYYRLFYP